MPARVRRAWTVALLTGIAAATASAQTVLRVDPTAPAGGTGAAWSDAINDLDDALAIAENAGGAHELWLRSGTYTPTVQTDPETARSATFTVADGVSILGGFSGSEQHADDRDPHAHETVLTGDLHGDDGPDFANTTDNAFHVVTKRGSGRVDGVTIRAGNAHDGFPLGDGLGAGVRLEAGFGIEPVIAGCLFVENQAGRGASIGALGACRVDRCVFRNNRTLGVTSGGPGVHTDAINQAATITNSLFVGNHSTAGGAATSFYAGLIIANCTFVGNVGASHSAIRAEGPAGFLALSNSILRDNRLTDGSLDPMPLWAPQLDGTTVASCNIGGLPAVLVGSGNMDAPAGFVDPIGPDGIAFTGDEDLQLNATSPCIDAGLAVPLTQFGRPPWSLPEMDLRGGARVLDGDGDGMARPDLGAYERTIACACETDGAPGVSIGDLLVYLSAWFDNDPSAERTDDAMISVLDLLAFLECWLPSSNGSCAG